MDVTYPLDCKEFESLPYIDFVLEGYFGAADGLDGVGIITNREWLPESVGRIIIWERTWTEAREKWAREVAPLLLYKPRS